MGIILLQILVSFITVIGTVGEHLTQGEPVRVSHCFPIRFWGTNPFHLLKSCKGITKPNLGLLSHSKTNLVVPGCGEGKCSIYCKAPRKEYRRLIFKRPDISSGFQESILKGKMRERVSGCMISSCTVLWLMMR